MTQWKVEHKYMMTWRLFTVQAWYVSNVSSWRCSGWCYQYASWSRKIFVIVKKIFRINLPEIISHLIHWGMGRFCFIFLASFLLIRKVFKADIFSANKYHQKLINIFICQNICLTFTITNYASLGRPRTIITFFLILILKHTQ